MVVSPEEVRWNLYPHIATHPHAKAFIQWLVLNARRPKTIDAYARAIDSFLKTFPEPERLIEAHATSADAAMAQRAVALRLFYDFLIRRQLRCDQINPLPRESLGGYGKPRSAVWYYSCTMSHGHHLSTNGSVSFCMS